MDGRGRLAQSLTWIARLRARPPNTRLRAFVIEDLMGASRPLARHMLRRVLRRARGWFLSLLRVRVPRGVGLAAAALLIASSIAYGTVEGGHVPTIVSTFKEARDQAANAVGFRITSVALSGNVHVSREEVLAIAGVTGTTSLLFLDVTAVRERLRTNPWIADATVLKLYPGELQVSVSERQAFALWQRDRRVSVIAADGTILEPYVAPGLLRLPLVVGHGAESHAKAFLALLERYPEIREQVRASILVGERRWNLRLRNGLDIRLPEADTAGALDRLVALERDSKLTTRDITAIDLRLPDKVTVRLSPAAAQSRLDASKDRKPAAAKKAGPA
jgi:cell division protein FtsQ